MPRWFVVLLCKKNCFAVKPVLLTRYTTFRLGILPSLSELRDWIIARVELASDHTCGLMHMLVSQWGTKYHLLYRIWAFPTEAWGYCKPQVHDECYLDTVILFNQCCTGALALLSLPVPVRRPACLWRRH